MNFDKYLTPKGHSSSPKKCLITLFLTFALIFCALGTACSKHEHVMSASWSYDSSHHWHTCTTCGLPITKIEHNWNEGIIIQTATLTEPGRKEFSCLDCDKKKTEQIPIIPHEHDFNSNYLYDSSRHWNNCTLCGEWGEKLDHEWNEGIITKPATLIEPGVKVFTCSICDKEKTEQIPIIPHEHSFEQEWSFDNNNHWHKCSECLEPNEKENHSWVNEKVITEPTVSKEGTKQFTCELCNMVKTETIEKLPAKNQPIFELSIDGTYYTVVGFDGSLTEITIPIIYNGLKVSQIGNGAFKDKFNVVQINLPNTITHIGNNAFEGCSNLTKINVPESVVSIGNNAFENCSSLSSVAFDIKEGFTTSFITIGDEAFKNCVSLTKIELPRNTQQIGFSSFAKCSSLKEVSLNAGLVSIGACAFDGCSSLTSISLPKTVQYLGAGAFRDAIKLSEIALSPNISTIEDITFQNCKALTTIEIHENINIIGKSAFSDCSALKTIRIMGDVKLGDNAFYCCENVNEIYYNSSLPTYTSNEQYVFYNVGVKSNGITLTIGKNGFVPYGLFEPMHNSNVPKITKIIIEEGATTIDYFSSNDYFPYVTEINIPSSVVTISDIHYSRFISLTKINVSENNEVFTSINGNLYTKDETSLIRYAIGKKESSFTVPNTVTNIKQYAFYNCTSLTSIVIPDSVTSIGSDAFYNCSSLTSIVIPDSVTSIGSDAFHGCDNLIYNVKYSLKYLGNDNNPYLYLADTTTTDITTVQIDSNCRLIREYAFSGCSSLKSIAIPDSVTSVGDSAFYNCPIENATMPTIAISYRPKGKLKTVVINGGTSIGDDAFRNCTSLTSVTIGDSVTSIGSYAFYYCTSLTSIVIPDSVTSIGGYAFYNCSSLTIYCEVASKPSGWHNYWNGYRLVIWGYKM